MQDTKVLLQQSRERLVISRVANDLSSYDTNAYRLALAPSSAGTLRFHLGEPLRVRWIEAYFPFTTPSYEVEVFFRGKWLEILGCGVEKAQYRSRPPIGFDFSTYVVQKYLSSSLCIVGNDFQAS